MAGAHPTSEMLTDDLQYLLAMVGLAPRPATVVAWSPEQRLEAEKWAVAVHLRASDNVVRVPSRPAFLPDPWKGPYLDTGDVFGGTQPTEF